MSVTAHPTMQELADQYGISRRLLFQAKAVNRFGCKELNQAAQLGVLALKACEIVAKSLSHDDQREFLKQLPTWTPRQRRDLLDILKGHLKAQRAGKASNG